MLLNQNVWVGLSGEEQASIRLDMANRHGLIAGATGTGKTVTLKVLAESFSAAGVPVFLADVKGDLSGMCLAGDRVADTDGGEEKLADLNKRIEKFGLKEQGFAYDSYPSVYWDIFGESGIPLRTTVSEFGPLLFSKLLDLNQTQTDILSLIFQIADDQGLLLLDLKDLKSMIKHVADNNAVYSADYGNIAKASANAILRGVVALEGKGGDRFFGEPALNIKDWFSTENGKGVINILDCRSLIQDPSLYATFLLWMISELFEFLPEVGDLEKPRIVFFFDEAHFLFKDTSKALKEKIEQLVRLVRSKGVGVYFVTQNPKDLPDSVLAQLGNKIQHALRAYTPDEEKTVKAAARSFRVNPAFDTQEAIMNLGTGEAVVSFLDEKGTPGVAQICKILPPQSMIKVIEDDIVRSCLAAAQSTRRLATSAGEERNAVLGGKLALLPVAQVLLLTEVGYQALVELELRLYVSQQTLRRVLRLAYDDHEVDKAVLLEDEPQWHEDVEVS
ncbi:MAG: DUF853 family protein [Bacteroidales bacterium]|nr:DUF853 family protein [Bacteroidales bacterium]